MKRVLVVEDEKAIRGAIVDMLEDAGFDVISAANGVVGLQLAHKQLPDLIVCDIMMPDLDGYGVLEELRRDPVKATIPFLFLTARATKLDVRRGMELGADDYLTKPFTRDELLKAVGSRLDKHVSLSRRFEQQMDDLRGSITLSLPHELRTPLGGILTGAEILAGSLDTLDRQDVLDIVKIIQESAERLNRLIVNYLLYAEMEFTARYSTALQHLRQNRVNSTQNIVAEVAARMAETAGRSADLIQDHREGTAHMAEAHFRKMVEELIDNAFKYSRTGTPVQIASGSGGGTFTLSVTDHGRGMTPEQVASIGAYMQFDRKLHEQQGSGLGLAIVRRLAEVYGGALDIESVPGQYTTVRVTLPALMSEA